MVNLSFKTVSILASKWSILDPCNHRLARLGRGPCLEAMGFHGGLPRKARFRLSAAYHRWWARAWAAVRPAQIRWILVDLERDALPSEPERCLPPLVVGGAQAQMRERAAKLRKVKDWALPPPPLSTPEPRLPPVVVGNARAPTAMRPAPNPPKSIDLGWPHRCPSPSPPPVVGSAQPKPGFSRKATMKTHGFKTGSTAQTGQSMVAGV